MEGGKGEGHMLSGKSRNGVVVSHGVVLLESVTCYDYATMLPMT